MKNNEADGYMAHLMIVFFGILLVIFLAVFQHQVETKNKQKGTNVQQMFNKKQQSKVK